MARLKKAVVYVMGQLSPSDRVCVLAFNHGVQQLFNFRSATSDQLSTLCDEVLNSPDMVADGGTNIWEALQHALATSDARLFSSAPVAIVLLTDGQGGAPTSECLKGRLRELKYPISVHCFGFGEDHDATTLAMIADAGQGTFTYVEGEAHVGADFARCIGGLTTLYAQEVMLTIDLDVGADSMVKIHSRDSVAVTEEKRTYDVALHAMNSDEMKNILFVIKVSPSSISESPIFKLSVSWKEPGTQATRTVFTDVVSLNRTPGSSRGPTNVPLNIQLNRVITATALVKAAGLANEGKLDDARLTCAEAEMRLRKSETRDDPVVIALSNDLKVGQAKFVDELTWNCGGRALLAQCSSGHWNQRSNSARDSSYTTPSQQSQALNWSLSQAN